MNFSKKSYCILGGGALLAVLLCLFLLGGRTRNAEVVEVKLSRDVASIDKLVLKQLDTAGVCPRHAAFWTLTTLKNRGKGNGNGTFTSGRYLIQPHTSTFALVRKLANGQQDPLRLTLGKYRTKHQLSAYLGTKLMMDSAYWMAALTDTSLFHSMGYGQETILAMFIPNTYEVYWSLSGEQLLRRMDKECRRFWTSSRLSQAQQLGMTPVQVSTLASIVEEETNKNDEKPLIASVYLNRLRKGMPLQADPTVKYAVGDPTIRRILNKHLQVDSPYNTYKYKGLPPGPICTPSQASIDAVLQNLESNYLYFCAKEDFSGYHNFAATMAEHSANAARFHRALSKGGIFN